MSKVIHCFIQNMRNEYGGFYRTKCLHEVRLCNVETLLYIQYSADADKSV